MAKKKLLISAGGTGGHIFPAQGLGEQWMAHSSTHEILFVAGGLASNRYFERSLFPFQEVSCSPLLVKNPLKWLRGGYNLVKGSYQSLKIIQAYQPDLVVGFGSYHTVPTLLAAKWLNIPIILHEANSIPGKANKWFAPHVECVGVHFPSAATLLKGNVLEVALPLRQGYASSNMSKSMARSYFGLDSSTFTWLVFGGSQGAQAINGLMLASLKEGLKGDFQVIHLTGDDKATFELTRLYASQGITATVKSYEKEMDRAWRAADCFLGRSGASTLAEAIEFEVPGLLIPYPYAADNHQDRNADFFVESVKGGLKLVEAQTTTYQLKKAWMQLADPVYWKSSHHSIQLYKTRPERIKLLKLILDRIENAHY